MNNKKIFLLIILLIIFYACPYVKIDDSPTESPYLTYDSTFFTHVKLSWNKPSGNVNGYEIIRKSEDEIKKIKISKSITDYEDTTPHNGGIYSYKLITHSKFGKTASNEITVNLENKKLAGYWKFNRNADDEMKANIIEVLPDNSTVYNLGIMDESIYLNAEKSQYLKSESNNLNIESQSICILFKVNSYNGSLDLINRGGFREDGWNIYITNGIYLTYSFSNESESDAKSIPISKQFQDPEKTISYIELDKWYFLIVVIDTENQFEQYGKLLSYINGECYTNHSMEFNMAVSESRKFQIGQYGSDKTNTFDGSIDEVRIYNYSLKPQEIEWLWDQYKEKINN